MPLTHLRYPQPQRRHMTIAAGFCSSEGILICADTLQSGMELNAYRSKITVAEYECGKVVFASDGCVEYAHAAIDKCKESLAQAGNSLRCEQIKDVIAKTLDSQYRKHVYRNPDRG